MRHTIPPLESPSIDEFAACYPPLSARRAPLPAPEESEATARRRLFLDDGSRLRLFVCGGLRLERSGRLRTGIDRDQCGFDRVLDAGPPGWPVVDRVFPYQDLLPLPLLRARSLVLRREDTRHGIRRDRDSDLYPVRQLGNDAAAADLEDRDHPGQAREIEARDERPAGTEHAARSSGYRPLRLRFRLRFRLGLRLGFRFRFWLGLRLRFWLRFWLRFRFRFWLRLRLRFRLRLRLRLGLRFGLRLWFWLGLRRLA
jgi:hypothetical protein